MPAFWVMSLSIRTNSHHPTLASAQPVVEDPQKNSQNLVRVHFSGHGRATIKTGSAVTKNYGRLCPTGTNHQRGPSASLPESPLVSAFAKHVWNRPYSGLSDICILNYSTSRNSYPESTTAYQLLVAANRRVFLYRQTLERFLCPIA